MELQIKSMKIILFEPKLECSNIYQYVLKNIDLIKTNQTSKTVDFNDQIILNGYYWQHTFDTKQFSLQCNDWSPALEQEFQNQLQIFQIQQLKGIDQPLAY